LEVEAGPLSEPVCHAEDDDAAHQVPGTVGPGAAVLPLGPDRVTGHRGTQYLGAEVRDRGEHLLPVPAHLLTAREPALRMGRGRVAVAGREACHDPGQVTIVGGPAQPPGQRRWPAVGRVLIHASPAFCYSRM